MSRYMPPVGWRVAGGVFSVSGLTPILTVLLNSAPTAPTAPTIELTSIQPRFILPSSSHRPHQFNGRCGL
jgi:hypothetical protein